MVKYKEVKYQLVDHLIVATMVKPKKSIITEWIELDKLGILAIRKGYACDGASGPTFDTPSSFRGAFAHDALYELIGMGLLNTDEDRYYADLTLYELLKADGMLDFRAWAWFKAVRAFGEGPARKQEPIKYAPSKCD